MMDVIARTGSFAAAARELGKVPSALTYNVRQPRGRARRAAVRPPSRQDRGSPPPARSCSNEAGACSEQIDASPTASKRRPPGWETSLRSRRTA
jgi:hypothetical protein